MRIGAITDPCDNLARFHHLDAGWGQCLFISQANPTRALKYAAEGYDTLTAEGRLQQQALLAQRAPGGWASRLGEPATTWSLVEVER